MRRASLNCNLGDSKAISDLEEQVREYVADLQSEMDESINATPPTPEERHQISLVKKRIVDTILAEARIDENRNISVKFRMDLLKLAENNLEPASKGKPRKLKKPFMQARSWRLPHACFLSPNANATASSSLIPFPASKRPPTQRHMIPR